MIQENRLHREVPLDLRWSSQGSQLAAPVVYEAKAESKSRASHTNSHAEYGNTEDERSRRGDSFLGCALPY